MYIWMMWRTHSIRNYFPHRKRTLKPMDGYHDLNYDWKIWPKKAQFNMYNNVRITMSQQLLYINANYTILQMICMYVCVCVCSQDVSFWFRFTSWSVDICHLLIPRSKQGNILMNHFQFPPSRPVFLEYSKIKIIDSWSYSSIRYQTTLYGTTPLLGTNLLINLANIQFKEACELSKIIN